MIYWTTWKPCGVDGCSNLVPPYPGASTTIGYCCSNCWYRMTRRNAEQRQKADVSGDISGDSKG